LISSEFPPGPGGIGNHAFNLANNLKLNDIDIKVLTVSDYAEKTDEEDFDKKADFEILRFKRYESRLNTYQQRINQISKTLKDGKFTHIIFSGRFSLLSSLLFKKYRGKIKFIAIGHGAEINSSNHAERILINMALSRMDLIIPVSNFSRSKLSKSLKDEKIVVIPNGFDIENMDEIKFDGRFIKNGKMNLVTVGTVSPRKGQHNVINALPKIIEKYPEAKYNMVGRLADLSKIEKLIEEKKYEEHLKFHGSLPNEKMYKVLNDSHIFLLLSESQSDGDFEGFGIAVIEANYFGLPAIGSKGSGLEDAINNGVSGILVDPKNPDEITEAVKTISDDYSKFSENAKQWAKQHHWSNIVNKYINAIETVDN
jgi:phosphatidylinositol alpha-1,6-mannosyltransferase